MPFKECFIPVYTSVANREFEIKKEGIFLICPLDIEH